jgi:hypothetical protein
MQATSVLFALVLPVIFFVFMTVSAVVELHAEHSMRWFLIQVAVILVSLTPAILWILY